MYTGEATRKAGAAAEGGHAGSWHSGTRDGGAVESGHERTEGEPCPRLLHLCPWAPPFCEDTSGRSSYTAALCAASCRSCTGICLQDAYSSIWSQLSGSSHNFVTKSLCTVATVCHHAACAGCRACGHPSTMSGRCCRCARWAWTSVTCAWPSWCSASSRPHTPSLSTPTTPPQVLPSVTRCTTKRRERGLFG